MPTPPDDGPPRSTPPRPAKTSGSRKLKYRAATITAGLAALGLLAATGGVAIAAPQPTVTSVQHKLGTLDRKLDQLDEQMDQVQQEKSSADARLKVIDKQVVRYKKQFDSMRSEVGEIAAQAYEQGNFNSSVTMLTSNDAQQMLNQSSILLELSATNNAEIHRFLAAAHQLTSAQEAARRAQSSIAAMRADLVKRKKTLNSSIATQKALLAQLTPAEQTGVGPGKPSSPTPSPSPSPVKYTGPTSSQADQAVAYVYDQLGCPYVYGGTGPCSAGFDCSGLMMEAWASAGVIIPRTSEEQAGLPNVSEADMQPGDILEFAGDSHVGLYVGGGMLIDAPHTGLDVEKVALSGWYSENLDAVVQP